MVRPLLAAFSLLFGPDFLSSTSASAAIVTPGDPVPGATSDIFTWAVGATDSTFASWERFDGFPGGTSPGFLPAGTSPTAQASFESVAQTQSSLTFESNQSLPSSGNAYGGLFGPGDASSFVTDAFATIRSGTSGGGFTRIVAQWETLGSELDYTSILLSPSTATTGTVAPTLALETARQGLGGTFGGEAVSYLAVWDLEISQEAFRVDFEANTNNVSIDNFRVDSFTQAVAFMPPTAVPEPGSMAAMGLIIGVVSYRRRRCKPNRDSSAVLTHRRN